MVESVLPQAIALWQAAGFDVTHLGNVNVVMADLPAGDLAYSANNLIAFDRTAQGYGWFMDPTQAPPPDKVDLLTVVTHELGHQLGFDVNQDAHDVMGEYLAPGVRRLSNHDEVVPAARLSAGQPAQSALAADIVAVLTAGQREGFALPLNPVPAGQKSDANLLSFQSPLLLSSAGEEVDWTVVAQAKHPASARIASLRVLDQVFAEEGSPIEDVLLNGLAMELKH
jgi:hypothetical protein